MALPLRHADRNLGSLVRAFTRNRLLPFAFGLSVALGLAELLLRLFSTITPDGAVFLFGAPCLPLKVPVAQVEAAIGRYEQDQNMVIRYDAALGWSPKPDSVSADGMYRYNAAGARIGESEPESSGHDGAVALFGDSTMHGTGVHWRDSIGARLQESWSGKKAVQNFALGAYGMDQALLRWRAVKEHARPSLVLFGFQAENVKRNGSIFRSLYTYETVDIPFSKPRFVQAGESLELVNSPTIPVAELASTLSQLGSSPLSKLDFFYQPSLYRDSLMYRSRLASFLAGAFLVNNRYVVAERERAVYAADGELGSLALRIMREFKKDVESSGARFMVVHLPRKVAVTAVASGRPLPYEDLLAAVREEFEMIDPLPNLEEAARSRGVDALYVDPWHYSGAGAEVVSQAIIAKQPS